MAKSRNTYSKGLNRDASKSKYSPENYYDALNIRVITDEGLSTGSIENEKGNSLSFQLPNLPATSITYPDGTITNIAAQSNLKIIGWVSINNDIILFSTSSTSQTPANTIGQIWKITYNESTNTIANITGNTLDVGSIYSGTGNHLLYNNVLNFSTFYRIEAKGRYENSTKANVYWTDNFNQLRSINVYDSSSYMIKPENLDIKPDVTLSQPKIQSIGLGNIPVGSMVQVGYRLTSSAGAQTIFSPLSTLIALTSDNPNTTDYNDYNGSDYQAGNNKSITYTISDIDTDFELIEHIAVVYENKDSYSVYKFSESTIPSTGTLTVTFTGSEDKIDLSATELNKFTIGFDRCKTIDVKDNILVAGNITTTKAEIEDSLFDARVYRFNSSQDALLTDSAQGNIVIDGASFTITTANDPALLTTSWTNVPEDHDCINPYNKETATPNWFNNLQYKYQADGTTLGGSGPFISYKFVEESIDLDKKYKTYSTPLYQDAGHIAVDRLPAAQTATLNETDLNNNTINYSIGNQFKNFSSPLIQQLFTGYTRGEVYRFGIEFITKKGAPTFVKWIGDIKFPEQSDGYNLGSQTITAGTLQGKSIGLEFTIDITSIQDQISGYRIVRAERTKDDISRWGTGTIMIIDQRNDTNKGVAAENSLYRATEGGGTPNEQIGLDKIEYDGVDIGLASFCLPDAPGFNNWDDGADQGVHKEFKSSRGACIFISPFTLFKQASGFEFKDGDYIKTTGYYKSTAYEYQDFSGGAADRDQGQGWIWQCRQWEAVIPTDPTNPHVVTNGYESFLIEDTRALEDGVKLTDDATNTWLAGGNSFYNISYGDDHGSSDVGSPFGIGNNIQLMILKSSGIGTHNNPSQMGWNYNVVEGTTNLTYNTDRYINNTFRFKEVAYISPISSQYNGNTYEDRSKQQYISTNHYQAVDAGTSSWKTFKVFGGDTFVNYVDQEYIQQYWNQSQAVGSHYNVPVDKKMSVAILMPMESIVNTDLNHGVHFTKDRDGTNISAYTAESFLLNTVYTQNNNTEQKFFAKDFNANTSEEFPHRLWASDKKVDGEQIDSWKSFKDVNYIDVNGDYGPINKVITFRDSLHFYQTRAFGIASINERSQITDSSGVQIALGTGTVLDDYRYISNITGTNHQFSVVNSGNALYHYDTDKAKLSSYRAVGNAMGIVPISDIKGLSSLFNNNIGGLINTTDKTLGATALNAIGVHGVYDHRHNRVLYTFLTPKTGVSNFTIGYSEYLDAFESFYSYKPSMYTQIGRRLLSSNPSDLGEMFIHNEGNYGTFYNQAATESYITMLIAPDADFVKIFNNIEYNSELTLNAADIADETLSKLEIYNEYQQSGVITLTVGSNVKRRMRSWRYTIGRDILSTNQDARFRNYSVFLKLTYDNNNNKRLVLHDVIISYVTVKN